MSNEYPKSIEESITKMKEKKNIDYSSENVCTHMTILKLRNE